MNRITLDIEDSLYSELSAAAQQENTSITNIIIHRLEEVYLQKSVRDDDCLKDLTTEAIQFAKESPDFTTFTVSDLDAIDQTELLKKRTYRRSIQRPGVAKSFRSLVYNGNVPGVACLMERDRKSNQLKAVKTKRNTTYIVIHSMDWKDKKHLVTFDPAAGAYILATE